MLIYCDSAILIYLVDGKEPYRSRAQRRLATLFSANDHVATSHLVRLECRVHPIRRGDATTVQRFDQFFTLPDEIVLPIEESTFDQATEISARWNFRSIDPMHLAAAVEGRCDAFLTNDLRLARYPVIPIELLP
jgi:predicted nucleic acid-binding protein